MGLSSSEARKASPPASGAQKLSGKSVPCEQEIQEFLILAISKAARIPRGDIDVNRPFAEYLGSREMVELSGDLEDFVKQTLSEVIAWDYPTVKLLSEHLAGNGTGGSVVSSEFGIADQIDSTEE
jgi:hypothetical protein